MTKHIFLFLLSSFILVGCKTPNVDKVNKTRDGMSETRIELANNTDQKMEQIATLATGAEYSLGQITNPPVEVKTAMDFNTRILSITGNPNIDEINKMRQITDLLNSEIQKERERGDRELAERDRQIVLLQVRQGEIENKYDVQIRGLEKQATEIAKKADKLQATVDEVNSWFGLGGVVYGLKRFFTTALTGIVIFGICFLGLRFFAATNPIAGAAFSIIEYIAAFFVNLIKGIAPKAVEFSKHIELSKFTPYKNTLDSIVDTLESLKTTQKTRSSNVCLDEVFQELDKNLNSNEKILVNELKSQNKYGS